MTQNDKERLFEIARKVQQQKEQAELAEIEDYEKLLSGNIWKVFKWFAYFSALMAILMTIDILVPGNKVKVSRSSVTVFDGYVIVDDVWYLPQIAENGNTLLGLQSDSFQCEHSLIFNEVKKVCWKSEKWQYDRNAEPIIEDWCARSWNTIYYYFPGPSIVFMIPLMVVGFKRMSPWFKFFRYVSWIVIYPSVLLLTTLLIL